MKENTCVLFHLAFPFIKKAAPTSYVPCGGLLWTSPALEKGTWSTVPRLCDVTVFLSCSLRSQHWTLQLKTIAFWNSRLLSPAFNCLCIHLRAIFSTTTRNIVNYDASRTWKLDWRCKFCTGTNVSADFMLGLGGYMWNIINLSTPPVDSHDMSSRINLHLTAAVSANMQLL